MRSKFSIMSELQHFSLAQMKRIFESNDAMQANNYISHNLAVARNPKVSIFKKEVTGEPHIMTEMRILILKKGWAEPELNLISHHFEAGELIFLGANGVAYIGDVSDDVEGIGISMSDDLFSLAIGNRIPKAFDGHLRDFHLHLEAHDIDFLDQLHHLIYLNTREAGHSPQVTLQLISAFLWYVDYLWNKQEEVSRQSQTREQRLFSDFIQLVNQNADHEHQIEFYASKLYMSPRYMSTLVKKVSGRSAKEWIDNALLTRIKIELTHSDKTAAQIADALNFPNASFFSKYFKRLTGMTPLEYKLQPSDAR